MTLWLRQKEIAYLSIMDPQESSIRIITCYLLIKFFKMKVASITVWRKYRTIQLSTQALIFGNWNYTGWDLKLGLSTAWSSLPFQPGKGQLGLDVYGE